MLADSHNPSAPGAVLGPRAPDAYWSTVTCVIGRCGSTTGKTTKNSSATTASSRTSALASFAGVRPGNIRQIHAYTALPLPGTVLDDSADGVSAPTYRRATQGRRREHVLLV